MADQTDPREAGGNIAGPGGPRDRGQVTFDMRRCVLAEQAWVAVAHPTHRGQREPDSVAILWSGRMNRPPDDAISSERPAESVAHLHMMSFELAADVVAELHALARRNGNENEFEAMVQAAWSKLADAGLTRRA